VAAGQQGRGADRSPPEEDAGAPAPVSELSYAEAGDELDGIIEEFETGVVDVDRLVERLERATDIVDELDRRLRRTRLQVEELVPRLEAVGRRDVGAAAAGSEPEDGPDAEPREEATPGEPDGLF